MAEPKYRFVKMKKPPRGRGVRGAMERQKFQRRQVKDNCKNSILRKSAASRSRR